MNDKDSHLPTGCCKSRSRQMESKSPEELLQLLVSAGFADSEPFVGCTPDEILELEQTAGVSLPESYKHFLRVMGKHTGEFLEDGLLRVDEFDLIRERAAARLDRLNISLPDHSFVFAARDNWIMYFDTTSDDDPPVFILEDGYKQPRFFYDTFSRWLTECVVGDVEIEEANRAEYKRNPQPLTEEATE